MSKKDANSFLKAVKRFGRIERMADIAEEVGPVLQDQSASARFPPPPLPSSSILFRDSLVGIHYLLRATTIISVAITAPPPPPSSS